MSIKVLAALTLVAVLGCVSAAKAKPCAKQHAAMLSKAMLEEDQGNLEKSIAIYETVLEADPKCTEAAAGIGFAYVNLENADLAVKYLKKAAEMDPKDAGMWLSFGSTCLHFVSVFATGTVPALLRDIGMQRLAIHSTHYVVAPTAAPN